MVSVIDQGGLGEYTRYGFFRTKAAANKFANKLRSRNCSGLHIRVERLKLGWTVLQSMK